jgi:hypothetical protein
MNPVRAGRKRGAARAGRAVALPVAGGFVGNRHFQPSRDEQGPEHLIPELGPVGASGQPHQVGDFALDQVATKNPGLIPAWSLPGPDPIPIRHGAVFPSPHAPAHGPAGAPGKLIDNKGVFRYLSQRQPDVLAEFENIIQTVALDGK